MSGSSGELILVGASLSHCLLAWFIKYLHRDWNVRILEQHEWIPQQRTWSCHFTDIHQHFTILKPLISHFWPAHEVRLPGQRRKFDSPYLTIKPEQLEKCIRSVMGDNLIFGCPVEEVTTTSVRLATGEVWEADCVLDARNHDLWPSRTAFQKFVGLHLRLERPHGLLCPVLMDACVPQADGYRFFYLLPFGSDEILVEDTRYSSNSDIDLDLFVSEIESYVAGKGWQIREVIEREKGALRLPLRAADFHSPRNNQIGVVGGFFHPTTGYSLPTAVSLAARISSLHDLSLPSVLGEIEAFRKNRHQSLRFFCMLNRMMFLGADPDQRYRIFQHFYSLPDASIERFYSGSFRWSDMVRLFSGKPPIPVRAATKSILTNTFGEGTLL